MIKTNDACYGTWADCFLPGSNPQQKYKEMCLHCLFITLSHAKPFSLNFSSLGLLSIFSCF